MFKVGVAVVIAVLFFHANSFADDGKSFTKQFYICEKKADAVTPEILDCVSQEFTKQDVRLNKAYRDLLSKLPQEKAEELRKVQRAWLGYVQAKCSFLYDGHELSGQEDRVAANYCSIQERAERATDLELLSNRF
ncbi:lysozyme inhibitor LprI family protein [Collimonas sp.]|jgi:uncharacterized protein YecT (DUF1311 family)|uniref:lysozyme inhibitor LprI family protein n=1 Tax=Collimonas sp. TaxID=1963772 RepID=UPI002B66BAF5|nr:lysozyme inhibitor LprI family protein [Collimonas sp.]HWX01987.1 lysozyme inhibitor LprI family protein [Collimonas sp.]